MHRRWYGRRTVRFRLLGLLEVTGDDGRAVEVVRGHESALLALLLLHANEALPSERIVEELWGDKAPENARKSVHIYISRLRKALGPTRIETTPAGYRLRLAPDELDVSHFESLADEGRQALARGSPDDAEAIFDRALGLWRVAPLADFRFESFAQAEARRLEELHDAVVADRVDARIACGRAQLVVDELEVLIERSPLWERPRGQLMRALYLTGRQADALEVYRRTHALLDVELGVEPGPELQRLERQILNHDPDLGEPAPAPRPLVRRRRFQLFVAGAAAVVVAVAFAAVALSRGGASSSTRPNLTNPTQAISAIDPRRNRVVSTTAVGRYPSRVASDRDALWVLNSQDETISRIDPGTHLVVHTFAPGSISWDIVALGGSLWVAAPRAHRILRFDGSTDELSARFTTSGPAFVASGDGKLWVGGSNLWTVEPITGKRSVVFDPRPSALNRLKGPIGTGPMVVLGRRVFLDEGGVGILRVDASANSMTESQRFEPSAGAMTQSLDFSRFPDDSRMTVGGHSLWLTSSEADELMRVDPNSLDVALRVKVGVRPTGVAYGAGSIWVANNGDGTVMRIEPASGRILATIHVGGTPYELAFAHRLVWVTLL
jgi:DNA-binding SARP family transcriptional activator/streptogramin lyase